MKALVEQHSLEAISVKVIYNLKTLIRVVVFIINYSFHILVYFKFQITGSYKKISITIFESIFYVMAKLLSLLLSNFSGSKTESCTIRLQNVNIEFHFDKNRQKYCKTCDILEKFFLRITESKQTAIIIVRKHDGYDVV